MTALTGDPIVGRTIAQYDILARVGGGGMGVVYRARDKRLGRTVALKFLPSQWSHDQEARQRFVREAQAASATNHQNICTIHDIETADDGQLFIVMAYYEGQTLKQRLASGPLPVEEALDIATQIADGLAKAHAQGVVHRDIKPGNVMLTEDGVRILDFGLATFADALKLTVEHSTLGTAAYMSPEQVRGQSADARSDVWAVGVILYEMLTGHVPFQGTHVEAIAYAVRHETPAPVRASRPNVGEEIEQLVFRTMHKEPEVRFKNGRELARALRQLRGQSMPLDLHTETVHVPVTRPSPAPSRRRPRWAKLALAAGAVAATIAGGLTWILWPAERVPVAIVPVLNQTGYPELDSFRAGLTHALESALADSRTVRVIGHDQLSPILAGVRSRGSDISSSEALQAIRANTSAQILIVVTLLNLNDGSGFRARVEFRNADSLLTGGTSFETPSLVSALAKDTVYRLIPDVADGIEERMVVSRRAALADMVRRTVGAAPPLAMLSANPDSAMAFVRGLDQYHDMEYAAAFASFAAAVEADPLNAVFVAWQSRVARLMRHDAEAERLAREATDLLGDDTPVGRRLFIEAVAAESRGEAAIAQARYEAMRNRHPDDTTALLELAAFQDRQRLNTQAIAAYLQALSLDSRLLHPHVELCRIYNRLNEPVVARTHGRQAVDAYAALGASGRHAQAMFCLSDSLRVGNDEEQADAVTYATAALDAIKELGYRYNLPRAYNYVALAEEARGRLEQAEVLWERSLASARDAGNIVLEPLVLMNLGATKEKLGRRTTAIEFLRQASRGFERLGDQSRAAESLFNLGAILLEFGGDSDEGLRNLRDALAVFRRLGNRSFEVRAAHVMSTYYRYSGRYAEAERELNRAVSLASERNLDFGSVMTAIRLAQLRLDTGDYEGARKLLQDVLPTASARAQLEAQLYLARINVRLGDTAAARALLDTVENAVRDTDDAGLLPPLYTVMGEWAYEVDRFDEARQFFARSAALLTEELPDVDALEAAAYAGLLDARGGAPGRGRIRVLSSIEVAKRIGHVSLQARGRVFLAEIETSRGRFADALAQLQQVPPDDESVAVERELRARAHYWTARARRAAGDPRAADDARAAASVIQSMADRLEAPHRPSFLGRSTVREMLGR